MVADGSAVTVGDVPKEDWFNPHIRLVAIVHSTGNNSSAFDLSTKEWTLCIVGSAFLSDSTKFLQVASWDGLTFRFYQVQYKSGRVEDAHLTDSMGPER